jgi:uncharacterized protein YeaO (DUF488 family)
VLKSKRAYDRPRPRDGKWIQFDRLWRRELRQEKVRTSERVEDLSPSTELRRWFAHHPDEKEEFKKRYLRELEAKSELLDRLKREARARAATLLFSGANAGPNNATLLRAARPGNLEKRRQRSSDRQRDRYPSRSRLGRSPAV